MPVNASPEYIKAEKEYLAEKDLERKIEALKKMISLAPDHKGAENLRAELKSRLKRLQEKLEKKKKTKKGGKQGIKKEDLQAVIIGFTNVGKSKLLSLLTNSSPQIAPYPFTTKEPVVGTMDFYGVKIQIIEVPAIGSEYYNKGLVNTADLILILVSSLEEIPLIESYLPNVRGKKLIVFNLKENVDERKVEANLKTKKFNFFLINLEKSNDIEKLKERIFNCFDKIRVYTKEPGKEKDEKPIILEKDTTIEILSKKIFPNNVKIKEARIWGPSSKFPGQIVGLKHVLKDLDVVEFKTK
ncbi:MAG: GTP-binding protein [Candidatus Pacearchaeota archaeon]|nr:MAG: GTP-binding protein [Candidatus Pacearchaeota archaeon]